MGKWVELSLLSAQILYPTSRASNIWKGFLELSLGVAG